MVLVPSEVRSYYAGLLIVQYRNKTKAQSTITLLANQSFCDDILPEFMTAFELDTAIGAQLDILGRIVGVPRQVFGLDLASIFFNFTDYTNADSVGFGLYSDNPYADDIWLRYFSNAIYTLSDFELRNLIRIKIIQNTRHPSTQNIIDEFYPLYGTDIRLFDNQDMSITYQVAPIYDKIFTIAQFLKIIPKPMGVELEVVLSSSSSSSSSRSSSSSSSSCSSSSSSRSSSSSSSSSSSRSSSSSSSSCSSSSSSSSSKSSSSSSSSSSSNSSSSSSSSSSSNSSSSSSSSSSSNSSSSSSSSSISSSSSSSSLSSSSSSSSSNSSSSSSSSSSLSSSSSSSSSQSSSSSSSSSQSSSSSSSSSISSSSSSSSQSSSSSSSSSSA